jgi:hypothetical protein
MKMDVPKAPWTAAARRRFGHRLRGDFKVKGSRLCDRPWHHFRATAFSIVLAEISKRRRAAAVQGASRIFMPALRFEVAQ